MRSCCIAIIAAVLSMVSATAPGQALISTDQSYSDGVHAYFSGNVARAEQSLAAAIAQHPNDPRPYYFRGLTLLRMGRSDEARSDFAIGASLEAQRPGRFAIGKSLERVQGGDRLVLEQYRRQARTDGASLRVEQRQTRYQRNAGGDAAVLRQRIAVPLNELMEPGDLPQWTNRPAVVQAPVEVAVPADAADRGAVETAADTFSDPFADDPETVAASDAADDPFAIVDEEESTLEADASTGEKIPSSKLLGIMGRVLRRAAPLPPLEGLTRGLPLPGGERPMGTTEGNGDTMGVADAAPFGDDAPFDFSEPPAAADAVEQDAAEFADPFGEPEFESSAPSDPDDAIDPDSSESLEDDPFGGF
jgi:hypothetical protein